MLRVSGRTLRLRRESSRKNWRSSIQAMGAFSRIGSPSKVEIGRIQTHRCASNSRRFSLFCRWALGCRAHLRVVQSLSPPGQGFRKSHPKRTRFSPPRLDSSHAQKALSELTNFSDRLLKILAAEAQTLWRDRSV